MTPPPTQPATLRAARNSSGSLARVVFGIGALAVLVQGLLVGARVWRERVPAYQTGQLADRNVISPVPLTVVDPEATARARELEEHRLPPLYRFESRIGDEVVARFVADYESRRSLFVQGLKRKWPGGLAEADLESPAFDEYLAAFRLAHPDFPLTDRLAVAWTVALESAPWATETAAVLRDTLRHYIVADEQPAEGAGYSEVLVAAPEHAGGTTDPADLSEVIRVQHKFVLSVPAARRQVRTRLDPVDTAWSEWAAGRLAANLSYDDEFTRAARARSALKVAVHVTFPAGKPLVTTARPVTAAQVAALAELKRYYVTLGDARGWEQWWLGGFGLLLVAGGGIILRKVPSTRQRVGTMDLTLPDPALLATAEPGAVRQGVIQQLAGWLKLEFVRRLISQRGEALATQTAAADQLDSLNDRLTKLRPEIRERVAEYERRIAQLERELEGANEVSCELIKTKISLARKELEIEKARSNVAWN